MSEPSSTEEWSEGYETPTEDPEEKLKRLEVEANRAYDTLIKMDGRPTRPIRPIPPWKKVLVNGELYYRCAEQDPILFYSGSEPGRNTYLTEADLIMGHWVAEKLRLVEELQRWQHFCDTQRWIREHRPDKAREEDMEWQRFPQDSDLIATLKKLKDWKGYQVYFQRGIDRSKSIIEDARRAVEAIQRKGPEVIENKGRVRGRSHRDWLGKIETEYEWLAAEEKRLEWVKQQLPAVLLECAESLIDLPISRRQMEERSELEAKRVFNLLIETGGRPIRLIRPVPDIEKCEYTDLHFHVVYHWEGESSHFEEELREWKKFLDYRQKTEAGGTTEAQLQDRQYAESSAQVDLWRDYRAYQQLEIENAKQWVEFWQQQVEIFQDAEIRYASTAEQYRSEAEEARKQVRPLESRLAWIEQQLSALIAECAVSTTEVPTSDPLKNQTIPPTRASQSSQTTYKDVRAKRTSRSTLHGNQRLDRDKRHAPAYSMLGPVHLYKVSKAAGGKPPRPRKQSTISGEHNKGQTQGPHAKVSPSLPISVTQRRSSRLGNNQNKSTALETGQIADLDKSARPPPSNIIMRRSDRILKQSDTALSPAGVLQIDPSRSLSRSKPKGRRTGNRLNPSPIKDRGITKRQNSSLSRNRNKD